MSKVIIDLAEVRRLRGAYTSKLLKYKSSKSTLIKVFNSDVDSTKLLLKNPNTDYKSANARIQSLFYRLREAIADMISFGFPRELLEDLEGELKTPAGLRNNYQDSKVFVDDLLLQLDTVKSFVA